MSTSWLRIPSLSCIVLLLSAGCRGGDAAPAPPPPAPPTLMPPTPVAADAPAAVIAPEPAAAEPDAPVPPEERALWEVLQALAREPGRAEELGWLVDAQARLLAHDDALDPGDLTVARCDARALRCTVSQPGGDTRFRFARRGKGKAARIVLRAVESEEP